MREELETMFYLMHQEHKLIIQLLKGFLGKDDRESIDAFLKSADEEFERAISHCK